MGRASSFNKEAVLNNALTLFWSRGFAASSLKQLEEVTDLHPGSLYHHFKNKEDVYLSALGYYLEHPMRYRINHYLNSNAPAEGLRRFFTTGYRNPKEEQYRNCCFLACASTELHLLPDRASDLVNQGIDAVQAAFEQQLTRLSDKNLLSESINATEAARGLTCFFLGLQLTARVKPNRHQLDTMVKNNLQHLLKLKA